MKYKKKGKEKEAVTARGGKLGSASYTESMLLGLSPKLHHRYFVIFRCKLYKERFL